MGLVRGVVVAMVSSDAALVRVLIVCVFVRVITELDVIRQFFRL
jgi:hypothetical protein